MLLALAQRQWSKYQPLVSAIIVTTVQLHLHTLVVHVVDILDKKPSHCAGKRPVPEPKSTSSLVPDGNHSALAPSSGGHDFGMLGVSGWRFHNLHISA